MLPRDHFVSRCNHRLKNNNKVNIKEEKIILNLEVMCLKQVIIISDYIFTALLLFKTFNVEKKDDKRCFREPNVLNLRHKNIAH
jgi:hypothetical protein